MKIFNIFASMLAFMLLNSLAAANDQDSLETNTTSRSTTTTETTSFETTTATTIATATTSPAETSAIEGPTHQTHPIPYRDAGDAWPKTPEEGNMRLWKPLWDTKEGILDAFSRGRDNLYEAFSWNNEKPLTIKDRSLDVLAASARFTLVPAALAILFPITYYNADSKGEWTVTVIDNSNVPVQENSRFRNFLTSVFSLLVLPAKIGDGISNKK